MIRIWGTISTYHLLPLELGHLRPDKVPKYSTYIHGTHLGTVISHARYVLVMIGDGLHLFQHGNVDKVNHNDVN
jgi:hypothetical protein